MTDERLYALLREVARTPDAIGLRVGDVVGRFELLRELGRGGFGIVFEARDTELGRLVAIKAMRPGLRAGDAFRLEARSAAALNHPNIVTLHDFGITNDTPYLVLERLRGETLARRCARAPLALAEILPIARQISLGIAHAHAADVIHRDLKPSNVFVTDEGRVKILDFGLSSLQSGGTTGFMPPEQQRGERGDARIDLFALGGTLHVMATGRAPGDGEVTHSGLRDLIAGLRASDPADRPASARAVHDELVALERGAGAGQAAGAHPFRYLEAFDVDDAAWFFGRDRESGRLQQLLRTQPLVAVVGPSGAGKTSLVAGGLVPRLRAHEPWELVRLRPGRDPIVALTERIAEITGVAADLRARPGSAGHTLRERARKAGTRILVFVDAFEELYTMVAERETRKLFADALASCCDDPGSPLRVVIAMREDFLSGLAEHAGLRDRVTAAMLLVGPPDEHGLVEMLCGPAERAGYALEHGLADELVTALSSERAPLPLLQLAASRLWERRDEERKVLRRAVLDELGGVPGVLAAHATDVMRGFSASEREIVRRLLPLLVTAERTRARRDRSELGDDAGVLERLAAGRLITLAEDSVELAHESLIEGWDELSEWLDAERDTAALRDRLLEAAAHWHERGQPRDLLWTGRTLEEAQRRLSNTPLGPMARSFLAAAATAARRARWLRRSVVVGVVAAACTIALVAVLALRAQTRVARQAEAERRAETARADNSALATARGLVERDPAAALEVLTSVSPGFTDWGRLRVIAADALAQNMPRILRGKTPLTGSLLFDGKTLYVGSDSPILHSWDLTSGEFHGLVGHTQRIIGLARSKDGQMVVSGGTDRRLLVWDIKTGTQRALAPPPGPIEAIHLSRDESHLLAGGFTWVRIWDLTTGSMEQIHDRVGPLWAAQLFGDNQVVSFRDHSVLVGARGTMLSEVARLERPIDAVVLSQDGRTLYTKTLAPGRTDRFRVDAVDLTTRQTRLVHDQVKQFAEGAGIYVIALDDGLHVSGDTRVLHHGAAVHGLVVSPTGRYVASTNFEGAAWVTDRERNTTRRLLGHEGVTNSLAFDPSETMLATASVDGTVRLWQLAETKNVLATTRGGTALGPVFDGRYAVVYEPPGSLRVDDAIARTSRTLQDSEVSLGMAFGVSPTHPIVSVAYDTSVRVWNVATGEHVRFEMTNGASGLDQVWPYDLTKIVVRDRERRIWVVEPGAQRLLLTRPRRPEVGVPYSDGAQLSPDGERFALVDEDATVIVWNLATGARSDLGRRRGGRHVRVAWAPDGGRLASAGVDNTIHVFSFADRTVREIDRGVPCGAIAFSPDGTQLASCCGPLGIQVTNLVTGSDVVYTGQRDACSRIHWSPDGTRIVSRADTGARLWDAATGESRALAVGDDRPPELAFGVRPTDGDADFASDGKSVLVRVGDISRFADDLPLDPAALRAELERIVLERIGRERTSRAW